MRQHYPAGARIGKVHGAVLGACSGFYLLHMIGTEFEDWRRKLEWRLGSRGFAPQLCRAIEEIFATVTEVAEREATLRDLHYRLHHPDHTVRSKLAEKAGLLALELRMSQIVERQLARRELAA